MSLPRARKDSNALRPGAETGPSTGELAMVGFTKVDYESDRPAKSNSDVASTESSVGAMGNDGTNLDAYHFQPDTIDSKSASSLSVASAKQEK